MKYQTQIEIEFFDDFEKQVFERCKVGISWKRSEALRSNNDLEQAIKVLLKFELTGLVTKSMAANWGLDSQTLYILTEIGKKIWSVVFEKPLNDTSPL